MFSELEEFNKESGLSVNTVTQSITTHLQALLDHFNSYLQEETAPEQYDWIRSPFAETIWRTRYLNCH